MDARIKSGQTTSVTDLVDRGPSRLLAGGGFSFKRRRQLFLLMFGAPAVLYVLRSPSGRSRRGFPTASMITAC